jgi:hypothetical protein
VPSLKKVITLAAGLNTLKSLIAANSTKVSMQLTWLRWRVFSGGPVAIGNLSMAAITDGDQWDVDTGTTEQAQGTDRIDATQIAFWPTNNGDKIFIDARSA